MTTTELALLTGADLDRAVAKCLGYTDDEIIDYGDYIRLSTNPTGSIAFCPSTDWAHGGPIIQRENIWFEYSTSYPHWIAKINCDKYIRWMAGSTHLIAAMRCYVAHKQGESK